MNSSHTPNSIVTLQRYRVADTRIGTSDRDIEEAILKATEKYYEGKQPFPLIGGKHRIGKCLDCGSTVSQTDRFCHECGRRQLW